MLDKLPDFYKLPLALAISFYTSQTDLFLALKERHSIAQRIALGRQCVKDASPERAKQSCFNPIHISRHIQLRIFSTMRETRLEMLFYDDVVSDWLYNFSLLAPPID